MLSDQLLSDLHKLPRADKLRVVQELVNDLAAEESLSAVAPAAEYEIWSPFEAYGAAQIIQDVLDEYKRTHEQWGHYAAYDANAST